MADPIAPVTSSFGTERVVLIGFGALMSVLLFDLFMILARRSPWGHWVRAWSHRYPVFAAGLALVVGALAGHFFFAGP